MLTLPEIVQRPAVPYVAIKADLTLPFGDEVSDMISRLFACLEEEGLEEQGPIFFKHNVVEMPRIEMEIGVPTDRTIEPRGEIVSGELPAGRYAQITYFGPYENLIAVNGTLIGWAQNAEIPFDAERRLDGEQFACRLEIYHNSPAEEPDPAKLKTSVSIKILD